MGLVFHKFHFSRKCSQSFDTMPNIFRVIFMRSKSGKILSNYGKKVDLSENMRTPVPLTPAGETTSTTLDLPQAPSFCLSNDTN